MRFRPALGLILLGLIASYVPGLRGLGDATVQMHATWWLETRGFGGFSGIELHPDGKTFSAVNDDGRFAVGVIHAEDRIELTDFPDLTRPNRTAYKGFDGDAEGIALGQDGSVFVAFEHRKVVTRFDAGGSGGTDLPASPAFGKMADNGSLEALAIDDAGRLYTMSEMPDARPRSFRVFRFQDGKWTVAHRIPARNWYRAVGADFGPDGAFYLLERRLTPLGFQSRIRRWPVSGDVWGQEATLWQSRAGQFDNLEGLSIRQLETGILRATMIADDNFWSFLDTEIVQIDIRI